MQLRTLSLALTALSLTLAAGAALAGPDWTTIENGRTAKQARQTLSKDTTPGAITLQRHGPRPQLVPTKSADKVEAGVTLGMK